MKGIEGKVIHLDKAKKFQIKALQSYFETADGLKGTGSIREIDGDLFEFLIELAERFAKATKKKEISWQITAMPGDPFYYFLKVHNPEGVTVGSTLKRNTEGKWETEASTKPIE